MDEGVKKDEGIKEDERVKEDDTEELVAAFKESCKIGIKRKSNPHPWRWFSQRLKN